MMPSRPSLPKLTPLLLLSIVAFIGAHAHADAPPQRYELRANGGIVYDTRTKLNWQRATAPNTYHTLADAKAYCTQLNLSGTGFRVPTLRELATIVDTTRANPAIDTTAFPNTSNDLYWSATVTPDPPYQPIYWGMFFDYGSTRMLDVAPDSVPLASEHLRCVR